MNEFEWLSRIPKVDLHCHLDGSLPIETVCRTTGGAREKIEPQLSVSQSCTSLSEYLQCFSLPLQCLQTQEGLTLAVVDLLKRAAAEQVYCIEIRFAPTLSLNEHLNYQQIVAAVRAGKEQGERESGVHCAFLGCAMRNHTQEQNLAMLRAIAPSVPEVFCGVDLAGDESRYPTTEQAAFFREAAAMNIPFTIHSGETGSTDNLRTALELGARRVGHGIALQKAPELMEAYRKAGIGIELCPTSNLQTKAVNSWAEYPLRLFRDGGLCCSINTDNRTVSGTNSTLELYQAVKHAGLHLSEVPKVLRDTIDMSFVSKKVKADYLERLDEFLQSCPVDSVCVSED